MARKVATAQIGKPKKKTGPARVYERRVPVRMSAGECERLTSRAKSAGLSLSRYLVESGLASNPERSIDPAGRERQERALFFLRKLVTDVARLKGKRLSRARVSEIVDKAGAQAGDIFEAFKL